MKGTTSCASQVTPSFVEKEPSGILLEPSNRRFNKYDKRFPCLYCDKTVTKFAQHTERMHKKEKAVRRLLLDTGRGTKARADGLTKLRRRASFKHNMRVLKSGQGTLIVERRDRKSVV